MRRSGPTVGRVTDARRPVSAERGHRISTWLYARGSRAAEAGAIGRHRARLVARARGVTLDLGAGTGLNLAHLPPAVTGLHLVEPNPQMRARLGRVVPPGAVVHAVGGEQMPLADASVDTVVTTLTLCSVDDPEAVSNELRRILRPGGQVLVMEHVRSVDPRTARRQQRLDPLYTRLAGGCHLDRDTGGVLAAAGFDTTGLACTEIPAPAVTRELLIGAALAP